MYRGHVFTKIKFRNPDNKPAKVEVWYTAFDEDGNRKEAHDTFKALPHQAMRNVWKKAIGFWQENVEWFIGDVDWRAHDIKTTTIIIEHSEVTEIGYSCTVSDESQKLPITTPTRLAGFKEREWLDDLCRETLRFMRGERDQTELFDSNEPAEEYPTITQGDGRMSYVMRPDDRPEA